MKTSESDGRAGVMAARGAGGWGVARVLSAVLGAAALAGPAAAQTWTSAAQTLGLVGAANTRFRAADMNSGPAGGPVPTGTYVYYQLRINEWSSTSVLWSSEARFALTSGDNSGFNTVNPEDVIYAGATVFGTQYPAPNAAPVAGGAGVRSIGWKGPLNVAYTTDSSAPTPLVLNYRQTFSSSPGATWRDTVLTLFAQAPAPPANDLCAAANDVSAAANATLSTIGATWVSPAVDMTGAQVPGQIVETFPCDTGASRAVWYRFTPAQSGFYRVSTLTADLGATPAPRRAFSSVRVFTLPTGCGGPALEVACASLTGDPLTGTSINTRAAATNVRLIAGISYAVLIARNSLLGQPDPTTLADVEDVYQWSIRLTGVLPPTPAYDECAGATDISAAANPVVSGGGLYRSDFLDIRTCTPSATDPVVCSPEFAEYTAWVSYTPTLSGVYMFSTSRNDADFNTIGSTAVSVYSGACGSLARIACDAGSAAGRGRAFALLEAGQTYRVMFSRRGVTLAASETGTQIAVRRLGNGGTDTEPNDNIFNGQYVDGGEGGVTITGTSTGTSEGPAGIASQDLYYLTLPAANGVRAWTVSYASANPQHTAFIVGWPVTNGQIAFNAGIRVPAQLFADTPLTFYTTGNAPGSLWLQITGTPATPAPYTITVAPAPSPPVFDLTPTPDLNFDPGSFTFTTNGRTGPVQTNTELWLYDGDFNAIANAGNDDGPTPGNGQSTLTRTLPTGIYVLAVSDVNVALNLPPATDDVVQNGLVMPFGNVLLNNSLAGSERSPVNLGTRISGPDRVADVAALKTAPYSIAFVRFNVGIPRCNAADLAGPDGEGQPDGCVNNGDFQAFFFDFFNATCPLCGQPGAPACNRADIANSAGDVETPDGCVNNGDFQVFFFNFFNSACPGCPG